ncbi:cation:proton antiporter [Arthrobacter sp. H35-D1]|uniref:cation:proton antiporter n=1 Tax=Arthrobacter sp. H35-D1 TaxID=3046202 RepID=UPI0024BAEEC1|nr:cation:proton antiporter [Arthrobacter sp. H35-D1]MDJ0315261.1 cation:proton antiporter [Arthrobacter sp. H35-D1]
MMDSVALLFLAAGIAALAAAILPRLLGQVPVSMPMVFFTAGLLGFSVLGFLPNPDPVDYGPVAQHLTELCVIISLMGAGLAINRPFRIRSWATTWRLLGITMPLSILAVALLGWWMLGLGVAAAILLAAALAPTDPVLASEVQVGEPTDDEEGQDEDEARFALTSEAGLNDGLAFPFVYLAIGISSVGLAPREWLGEWIFQDLVWRLAAGFIIGILTGWLLGKLFFSTAAKRLKLSENAEGFSALAATFLAYGAAELVNGYGFLAVFVGACTIRAAERSHGYHRILHNFVEQIERILTVVILVLLGGAVARGLLAGIGWKEIFVVCLILLVIRPVAGWLGLARGKTGPQERAVISFFGVRGIGSLFYMAYALEKGAFGDGEYLWAMVGLTVTGSILLHGAAASPVMNYLDAQRIKKAKARGRPDQAPTTAV